MEIKIRKAKKEDAVSMIDLLKQVNNIHAQGRPDIFIKDQTKYSVDDLLKILGRQDFQIFVAVDENDMVVGYCFCVIEINPGSRNMKAMKTLYIDDLCVDESRRGLHIGKKLFEYVKRYALDEGFYNITLNVWNCNPSAMAFYNSLGMTPLKIAMELVL